MVQSVNFVVLGKQDIASEFGKKGTETDLTLYDRKESDVIKTWVTPSGFPEKIQPLFQAINLAEYVIFHVDKLDKFTGEQIIALDSLKKEKGILSHTFEVDESKLDAMIKGTVVEKYTKVDQDKIKEEMDKLVPLSNDGPSEMVIDHCFDVKGVGTVILGKQDIASEFGKRELKLILLFMIEKNLMLSKLGLLQVVFLRRYSHCFRQLI